MTNQYRPCVLNGFFLHRESGKIPRHVELPHPSVIAQFAAHHRFTYQRVNRIYARFVQDGRLTQRRSGQLMISFGVLNPRAMTPTLIHADANGKDDEEIRKAMRVERRDGSIVDTVHHIRHPVRAIRILAIERMGESAL